MAAVGLGSRGPLYRMTSSKSATFNIIPTRDLLSAWFLLRLRVVGTVAFHME